MYVRDWHGVSSAGATGQMAQEAAAMQMKAQAYSQAVGSAAIPQPPKEQPTLAGLLDSLNGLLSRAHNIADVVENAADRMGGTAPSLAPPPPLSNGPGVPVGTVEALASMVPLVHFALARIEEAASRIHVAHG